MALEVFVSDILKDRIPSYSGFVNPYNMTSVYGSVNNGESVNNTGFQNFVIPYPENTQTKPGLSLEDAEFIAIQLYGLSDKEWQMIKDNFDNIHNVKDLISVIENIQTDSVKTDTGNNTEQESGRGFGGGRYGGGGTFRGGGTTRGIGLGRADVLGNQQEVSGDENVFLNMDNDSEQEVGREPGSGFGGGRCGGGGTTRGGGAGRADVLSMQQEDSEDEYNYVEQEVVPKTENGFGGGRCGGGGGDSWTRGGGAGRGR